MPGNAPEGVPADDAQADDSTPDDAEANDTTADDNADDASAGANEADTRRGPPEDAGNGATGSAD